MVKQQTVDEQANRKATSNLTPAQEFLQELYSFGGTIVAKAAEAIRDRIRRLIFFALHIRPPA